MKPDYLMQAISDLESLANLEFKSRVDKQMIKREIKSIKEKLLCLKEELEDKE